MAVVTYALRAGGFWLMGRVTLPPRMEAALIYLPGAVLTSLIVPPVIEEGLPGVMALMATALAMWWRGNLLLAMVAGVGTVWLARIVL